MKCPRCREVASAKAKFCAGCGAELAARATLPRADAPPALGGGLERVLAAIARTAARLCDAKDAQISLVEADCLRQIVHCGTRGSARAVGETYPLSRGIVSALAVLDRRTIHVRDLRTAARTRFKEMAAQAALGTRTVLASPLLRDGAAIGVILLQRTSVRPFTSRQIALLQTFADQAAIAIENAHLFTELQAKNRDSDRSARPADGDERDPARHQPVADRRAAGLRHDREERRQAVRRPLRRAVSVRRRAAPSCRPAQLPPPKLSRRCAACSRRVQPGPWGPRGQSSSARWSTSPTWRSTRTSSITRCPERSAGEVACSCPC